MKKTADSDAPTFDPRTSGSEHAITRLGTGSIGGKAAGLLRIQNEILPRFDTARF